MQIINQKVSKSEKNVREKWKIIILQNSEFSE